MKGYIAKYNIADIIRGKFYDDSENVSTFLIEDIRVYHMSSDSYEYCLRNLDDDDSIEIDTVYIDHRFIKVA